MATQDTTVVTLPDLHNKSRFMAVPRRYEETKPAVVQGFTHQRILDLGNEIHNRTLHQCHLQLEEAVKEAEEAVWAEAEISKQAALEKAAIKAKKDQEKALNKLMKTHEKALKAEALRVEGEMQKLAIEQVQKEREAGEVRLKEAVLRTEQLWKKRLEEAVKAARKEEQQAAAKAAAAKAEEFKLTLEMALKKAAEEKIKALRETEVKKNVECEKAVAKARKEEQEIAASKLVRQQRFYEQQIEVLHSYVKENKQEIADRQRELAQLLLAKKKVEDELVEMREEFQKFINQVKPYQPVLPADYVLPPLKSVDSSAR